MLANPATLALVAAALLLVRQAARALAASRLRPQPVPVHRRRTR